MRNWKKVTAAMLALLLAGAMTACAGSENTGSGENSSSTTAESSYTASSAADGEEIDYSRGLTDDGMYEGVTALDYVTLPDYRGMEVPEDVTTITDEDVDEAMQDRLASFAETQQVTDREVCDGDTVNIDYVGSIDGVEFDGGNTGGMGTTVTIGVTSYIDDFLEQLIGHMPGETFDVNVTFPEPYENNPDLSGKDAVFVTTINYIQDDTVPELTDEFVEENWKDSEGWATAAEATEGVRAELAAQAVSDYLWEQISEQAEVSEVPAALYDFQVQNMRNYYLGSAQQYSMEIDEFLSQYTDVESLEELEEQNKEQLESSAKTALILQALCEDMGISADWEDVGEYFKRYYNTDDTSRYEEVYGKPYLTMIAREQLAFDSLGKQE